MSKDYEVGYRRPPRHTRFKKGRSGNPQGRPKGRKNMATIMKEVLARRVVIKQNGRERRVTFSEAFVHRLAGRALEGNTRDMIALMKAMHDYLPEALEPEVVPHHITVHYVLPDGKSMESYSNENDPHLARQDSDPEDSKGPEPPAQSTDDDDWLK